MSLSTQTSNPAIVFPRFTGVTCNMMPFIQGDPDSLPPKYQQYAEALERMVLDPGKIGHLTIQETFVKAGKTQRGYSQSGRNAHVEIGRITSSGFGHWGFWGHTGTTLVNVNTRVAIASNLADTCRLWPGVTETRPTEYGELDEYLEDYPVESGVVLGAGEVAIIGVLTPHESTPQKVAGRRQFLRVVGQGVLGRESYFTQNPLVSDIAA
jgi:hypothetical protein